MKITQDDKRRVSNGDVQHLKALLLSELEGIRDQLVIYRPDNQNYDNVLKGRGSCIKEILELLSH